MTAFGFDEVDFGGDAAFIPVLPGSMMKIAEPESSLFQEWQTYVESLSGFAAPRQDGPCLPGL